MKINGKEIANRIFEELKKRVIGLKKQGTIPHLAIILIGNDPASHAYVKQKIITAEKIGIKTSLFKYPSSISTKELLTRLNDLNHLSNIHGIIVQQPLPPQINLKEITLAINPKKDVDGFHPHSRFQSPIAIAVLRILEEINAGDASGGRPIERPQKSAGGAEDFFEDVGWDERVAGPARWLKSKKIVIIGKGETGGKPIIETLQKMNIKPLVVDSKTPNPPKITKSADIIISAVGKPDVVRPEMIKKNSILISIGLSKGKDGKLHGDYDEEKIKSIASFYTPTPGGVGPVNVAMLLKNLVITAEKLSS